MAIKKRETRGPKKTMKNCGLVMFAQAFLIPHTFFISTQKVWMAILKVHLRISSEFYVSGVLLQFSEAKLQKMVAVYMLPNPPTNRNPRNAITCVAFLVLKTGYYAFLQKIIHQKVNNVISFMQPNCPRSYLN